MNPTIQANERLVYLKSLPSAVKLHDFIKELDEKYNVDSSDPDNTFGRVQLDDPIVKHGVSNTLYFAKISTYHPEDMNLPTYQTIPHADSVIFIDKKGNVSLAESAAHVQATRIPITIDADDIGQLRTLRNAFKTEVEQHAPRHPDFSDIEKYNDAKNDDEIPIPFESLGLNSHNRVCDNLLKAQGFATDKENHIEQSIKIKVGDEIHTFEVKYYRLGHNKTPHFTTSYIGWQNQNDMPHNHPAYAFYEKWGVFHLGVMTIEEWTEMKSDLDELIRLTSTEVTTNESGGIDDN